MFSNTRIQAQKNIIARLTQENKELQKELNGANERFETMQREQFQRVQYMDELLKDLRILKKSYEVSISSLDEARENFDAERVKYQELQKDYKKQTEKLIKEFKKGG